jgi:hypothetical protein
LSHLPSGQLSSPLGPSLLPDHILAPSRLPLRPYKGLNSILSHSHYTCLSRLLWTFIPSATGPAPPPILSHSHTIPLSLLLWTVIPTAIGPVPPPILSHSHTLPLSLLLWTVIPTTIGPAPPSILSHSHRIHLSLFYFRPPTHLPLALFLAYRHSFPIGQLSPLDFLYNQRPLHARLIHRPDDGGSTYLRNVSRHSVKNKAVHPRRSELHIRRRENLKSQK